MLFNSLEFFIFFPVVVSIYFLLPVRNRILFLLIASYFFYASWKVEYLLLIILSTLIDFWVGRKIYISKEKHQKRLWLALSLIANLSILIGFKYFNFFSESVAEILTFLGLSYTTPLFNFLLPIGISFYTFQSMSYSIDIYNNKITPEKRLSVFALYVSYFPQLVAGPIERAKQLIPQLKGNHQFDYERVVSGLKQMLWGFFKKLVIADNLGVFVNTIYDSPDSYGGVILLFGTYCFAFQIYCDFSGYSDIAIGASRVLGIQLMENFKLPYLSKSIPEFWQRWHISLSTWFRDYVYIPLGGNRVSRFQLLINILIVFLVSGLWHGANWTFIVWGGLHGIFYLLFRQFKSMSKKLPKFINIFITFQITSICWVFFRANNIVEGIEILQTIFNNPFSIMGLENVIRPGSLGNFLIIMSLFIGFVMIDPFMDQLIKGKRIVSNIQNHIIFGSIMTGIFLFGFFYEVSFIYFQF